MPSSVPRTRAILRQLLSDWQLAIMSDTALLLMSELVTNAVEASADAPGGGDRSGRQIVVATVHCTETGLLLEVWDANPDPPVLQDVDLTSDGGEDCS